LVPVVVASGAVADDCFISFSLSNTQFADEGQQQLTDEGQCGVHDIIKLKSSINFLVDGLC